MLVFGDATQREAVAPKLERLRGLLAKALAMPPGIGRHAGLVSALIEAGELAQGIADARFRANGGQDTPARDVDAAMGIALALARLCAHSWHTAFRGALADPWPSIEPSAARLPAIDIDVRQPEGYAFYALYPESYLEAARRLGAGPWRVIGLRSIGTGLAAVVAAALGDPQPTTLRPVGHPFDRRIAWRAAPRTDPWLHHVIVDEGPGLSGSSMAAVIRRLREDGVARQRIHLLTAHARGPGAQSGPRVRALWMQTSTHAADFDATILQAAQSPHRLQTWVETRIGTLREPLQAIDGGRWRGAHGLPSSAWPPVHPWQERRKFLAHAADGVWLVKFAGLGHRAEERMACAGTLAGAGFSSRIAGACHGFLIERWQAAMTPLSRASLADPDLRRRLVLRVADCLAFRARMFPMPQGSGATLRTLCDMARHNTAEALGAVWAEPWERHLAEAARLQARVRYVRTDSRMQAWEWLDDGTHLLKTDAIDHHSGHDLIGCQDPAWDVAGARCEFALDEDELAALLQAMQVRGLSVDPSLLRLYAAVYPAFQLGHATLAARDTTDDEERGRIDDRARDLTAALRAQLA